MIPGALLKKLRLANGLTLEEVGNAVGVGKSTVRKWETGTISNMKADKIEKLANILGVDVDYIIGFSAQADIDIKKNRIREIQDELKTLPAGDTRRDLEYELWLTEESIEDCELANRLNNMANQQKEKPAISDGLTGDQKKALDLIKSMTPEELKALLTIIDR